MVSDAVAELPFEIITEILSWLPVDALLRCKCVCKQWHCLLLDYKFIAKHMDQARPLQLSCQIEWESNKSATDPTILYDANFKLISAEAGLFLEESLTSRVFRIRNFATNQVLYLPDTHEQTHYMMGFVFDSFGGDCKVACCYAKEKSDHGGLELEFKVLSIGKDDNWRTLKLPNQNDKFFQYIYWFRAQEEAAAHLVKFIREGEDLKLEVQSLDIWSECFTTNTLPRGAFLNLETVAVLRWNYLVAVGEMVEESLNVWVLEDFKEHKWCNIIVPLKFLKDNPGLKDEIRPHTVWSDDLQLHNAVKNNFIVYDMKRGVIKETRTKSTQRGCFSRKPSLVTLKGMKNEN